MKPDRELPLEHLTAELREKGAHPARDLWPGISAAIDEMEKAAAIPRPVPRRRRVLWPLTAVAATLLLLVVAGGQYQRDLLQVADGLAEEQTTDQLTVLDQALDELNDALAENGADNGLTRLLRMVEQTRGDLVRMNAEGWQRGVPAGPVS
ncbi:MAG: hypothetical protein ACK2U9_10745 [Anaerolineae bacterium]